MNNNKYIINISFHIIFFLLIHYEVYKQKLNRCALSIMVRISLSQREDPGSIPGGRIFTVFIHIKVE